MATPDHFADFSAYLKTEMAMLTAVFVTEQAVKHSRRAVKLGRTAEIIEWANCAATAVAEVAELVTFPDEDADTSVAIQASMTGSLGAMIRAEHVDDADGVLDRGELVGDAVANHAAVLERGETR